MGVPRITKDRQQFRKEAVERAAEDLTSIFEVLDKATSHQPVARDMPISNLLTQAGGATGIVQVAAELFEKHYERLEFEVSEQELADLLTPRAPSRPFSAIGSSLPIRRRHIDGERSRSAAPGDPNAHDVLCLRCGMAMSRHQPGQDGEDETPCPDA